MRKNVLLRENCMYKNLKATEKIWHIAYMNCYMECKEGLIKEVGEIGRGHMVQSLVGNFKLICLYLLEWGTN